MFRGKCKTAFPSAPVNCSKHRSRHPARMPLEEIKTSEDLGTGDRPILLVDDDDGDHPRFSQHDSLTVSGGEGIDEKIHPLAGGVAGHE